MRNPTYACFPKPSVYVPDVNRIRAPRAGLQGKKIRHQATIALEYESLPWQQLTTKRLPSPLVPDNNDLQVIGNGYHDILKRERKTSRNGIKDPKYSMVAPEMGNRKVMETVQIRSREVKQQTQGMSDTQTLFVEGKTMDTPQKNYVTYSTKPYSFPPLSSNYCGETHVKKIQIVMGKAIPRGNEKAHDVITNRDRQLPSLQNSGISTCFTYACCDGNKRHRGCFLKSNTTDFCTKYTNRTCVNRALH